MKFIDHTIIGEAGETLYLEIDSRGTSHLVTYQLDGREIRRLGENERLRFTFGRQQDCQRWLTMTFDFSESTGGEYQIRLIGASAERAIYVEQVGTLRPIEQFNLVGLEGDPSIDAD